MDAESTGPGKGNFPPRPLSSVLLELGRQARGPVTVEAVRDALEDRSFAALLVFFAAINMLPFPPGSSLILGIPLLIVTVQMVIGRRKAWLPAYLLGKSISEERFQQIADRLAPRLMWLERLVRPRYWPFPRSQADRWIGLIGLVLALAVVIPVPFGNWLPAFAIALIGIALSERDGLLLAVGSTLGLISIAIIGGVLGAAGAFAFMLFG